MWETEKKQKPPETGMWTVARRDSHKRNQIKKLEHFKTKREARSTTMREREKKKRQRPSPTVQI